MEKDERQSGGHEQVTRSGGSQRELWLGYNFGGLQFHYRLARAYRRNAVAKEANEKGLYRDLYSQEEFDFYEPFPGLMDS